MVFDERMKLFAEFAAERADFEKMLFEEQQARRSVEEEPACKKIYQQTKDDIEIIKF
jgi:hypothetical protein